ncbi:replicative DNA helicase [Thermodesulforhabdus norvegica]|uniref:Replicative DNA helicase n=1 Tax=Thermodesulforhabdus norvegica TaxID=39841 RepID=A0A1I4U8Q6_9BACT|nr:replicative DNA helicase [Thermodesulforhabdus norvegica]SFM85362.1 primary replicative DNA helicase [Thermodesulforhabdus norvegica]
MSGIIEELQKIPPHSREAEQSLLGGLLLDPSGIPAVLEILKGDEFYFESHRKIFRVITELFEANKPIDLVTVFERLRERNELEDIGGLEYLVALTERVPSAANAPVYARIVADRAVLRSLIQTSGKIISWCYSHPESVEEVLDKAEAAIFQISESRIQNSCSPIEEIVKHNLVRIEDYRTNRGIITGIPSHFIDLDRLTAGFQKSDLIIIAGRPGMGKTAFALNIARNVALESNIPVAFFSLEMSKEQVAMRLMCAEARVDSQRIRTGFLSQEECRRLMATGETFMKVPLFIDDQPAITPLELRAKARRLMAEHGLGLIIIDYLQLMRIHGRFERREQEISEISRSLKNLARELNIPVIALSQLNRKVEERHDKRPQLADLRESGAIEQDADVILCLYRDEVYNRDTKDKGIAEVLIRKQRNGPQGTVRLGFIDSYTRFENLAYERDYEY